MKALLIHWFEGRGDSNFFPWLKEEMENLWIEVISPTLPNPDYESAKEFLQAEIEDFWEDDMILGHSLWGKFALRIAENTKFKNLVLVAPVTYNNLDFEYIRQKWVGHIDSLEKITEIPVKLEKVNAENKIVILSDHDERVPMSTFDIFDESWDKITINSRWHCTDDKIPEILEKIKELM